MSRTLRSSASKQLFVLKTKLNIGKHAFSVAAPMTWNELPIAIKSSDPVDTFRKKLKTYLFEIALHHRISAVSCSNDEFFMFASTMS